MAHLAFGTVLFLMIFVQATIVPRVNPLPVAPDLVLLLLFLLTASRGIRRGLAWLFVTGIVVDVVAMDTFGVNGLAMLPAVLLAGPARDRVFQASVLLPMVLVLVASLLHGALLSLLRGGMPGPEIALAALLNVVLVPLFFFGARRFA